MTSPRLFIAMICLTLMSSAAFADVINVPTDYPTIQEAIDASSDGDEVVIAPGLYNEFGIQFNGKAITLRGSTGSDGLPTTAITSGSEGSIMSIGFQQIDPTVRDITFTGSTADTAVMTFHSNATFINCTFLDNAGFLGGGFYNLNGGPSFIDCRFIDNTATWGGGYACWETGQPEHPIFTRCLFEGNTGEIGGGMANLRSQPTLNDCVFRNNQASFGGGLYNDGDACCSQWEGNITLIDCLFEDNEALESGGGIYNAIFGFPVIQGTTLRNNTAIFFGSGMFSEDQMLPAVSDSVFCGNQGTSDQITGPWTDDGDNAIEDNCQTPCPGDLDGNGDVSVDDLLALLAVFELNADGDCDGDDDTDVDDLLLLIGNYGDCS